MSDSIDDIITTSFLMAISDLQSEGLSESEIAEKVSKVDYSDVFKKMIDKATENAFSNLKNKVFEIEHYQTIANNAFFSHHNKIWGDCFAVSEAMYVIAIEAAEEYNKYVNEKVSDENKRLSKYTFLVLQYIHGRCCQEYLEILYLMKLGFADCAYARWRSMFELCCIAHFIKKHGEIVAKQYFDNSKSKKQGVNQWTAGVKDKNGKDFCSFNAILKDCDIDEAWKTQYEMACLLVHGSPQGTFKKLCLKDDSQLIVVGHSDYGISIPAEHSAISLQWITTMFLSIFPNFDSIVHLQVLQNWVEVVRDSYSSKEDECF